MRLTTLRLAARLVDPDLHGQRLAAAAVARAAHRRGAEIIEADRDPHIGVGRADAVGRIEADPAEVATIGFGPGVAGVLLDHAVGAVEVAADIARRNAELRAAADEDMGQVLADAALERESFGRRGRGLGRIGVEGDLVVQPLEQRVQQRQRLGLRRARTSLRKVADRLVGLGQRRLAQEQARRKPLDRAAHDARRCPGFRPRPRR